MLILSEPSSLMSALYVWGDLSSLLCWRGLWHSYFCWYLYVGADIGAALLRRVFFLFAWGFCRQLLARALQNDQGAVRQLSSVRICSATSTKHMSQAPLCLAGWMEGEWHLMSTQSESTVSLCVCGSAISLVSPNRKSCPQLSLMGR